MTESLDKNLKLFIRRFRLSGEESQDGEIMDNLVSSLRQRANLSQRELGEGVGITQARIAQLESGREGPITLRRLAEIARECGFDVNIEFKERE